MSALPDERLRAVRGESSLPPETEAQQTYRSTEQSPVQTSHVRLKRRLIDRLKDYPNLKDRVEGFMLAEEWRILCDEMREHLLDKERVEEDAFWRSIHDFLMRRELTAPFPAGVANLDETRSRLDEFRDHHKAARQSARSVLNGYQAPDRGAVAPEILGRIETMLDAAVELETFCREDTKVLLANLKSSIDAIFDEVEEGPPLEVESERAIDGSLGHTGWTPQSSAPLPDETREPDPELSRHTDNAGRRAPDRSRDFEAHIFRGPRNGGER